MVYLERIDKYQFGGIILILGALILVCIFRNPKASNQIDSIINNTLSQTNSEVITRTRDISHGITVMLTIAFGKCNLDN